MYLAAKNMMSASTATAIIVAIIPSPPVLAFFNQEPNSNKPLSGLLPLRGSLLITRSLD